MGCLNCGSHYESYGDWIEKCERKIRQGIKQRYCVACGKWRWDDEACCVDTNGNAAARQTKKEFWREAKRIEREVKKLYPSSEEKYRKEVRQARKDGLI